MKFYPYIAIFTLLTIFNSIASAHSPAAIASAHPLATEAGFEILAQGGNAFDAAIAVSAALAVVEPAASGLGGGGFWLLHREKDHFEVMIDGRETAPQGATRDMFIDMNGNVNESLSKNGGLAAAIPGLPAALEHLALKYGQLPLAQSLQPAIRYARQGFQIGKRYRKLLAFRAEVLKQNSAASHIFLSNQQVPAEKSWLKQPDLARTLEKIAEQGKAGFYQGEIAQRLVKSVIQSGGIWTVQDLQRYQVIERVPIQGEFHGIKITSAAPPSSGGIVLIEALNILATYPLTKVDSITRKHLITEALRRAYHDRSLYLGDSDFVNIPVSQLLNPHYAAGLRSSLRLDRALPSEWLSDDPNQSTDGIDTTHFSIIDAEGNRVAATLSINYPFGAGIVAEGTGVVLNDQMDDFSVKPGEKNSYGLTGGTANAIAGGKRMLSSMTPTFLEDEQRIAVLGAPGGSRIISMILLAVLDFAEQHLPESWVKLPRFHHQYLPDQIEYEPNTFTDAEIRGLQALGHHLTQTSYTYGDMQAVYYHKKTQQLSAASDPRGEGSAVVK
ncbi:MAG: Gamma-glutamyltranspeptidase [Pseudomonadota bacterium]|jgi:gamma-glutamyltranspeptidase/glutathione hydrolase